MCGYITSITILSIYRTRQLNEQRVSYLQLQVINHIDGMEIVL